MLIQAIIIVIVALILPRIFWQYRAKKINWKELLFWALFWLAVAVVALLPQTVNIIADYLGVGRGVDVAIYVSIIVLFYIVFRVFVRLDKLEKDISKIVRHLALEEKGRDKKNE